MLPNKKYTPQELLRIALRWKWLIICPPLVGLFIALIVSSRLPDVYESDMLITIVPQRVPDSFVRTTVTLKTEERLETITQQAMSRTILEEMIVALNLYPAERERLPMEDVVARMRTDVDVQLEAPRRGPRGPEPAHAFHVRFRYSDPEVAAQVTQRLGSLFVDENARERGALAEATNGFLETQLSEARARLEEQERRLEAFRQRHGSELPTLLQSNLQAIQSTQMQIQAVVESLARDRDRKLMLERIYNEARNEPPPVAAQPPAAAPDPMASAAASTRQQLETARAALARLELRLKPEHPDVIRARRLVADLTAKVDAEGPPQDGPAVTAAPATTPEEASYRERLRQMRAELESLDRQTQFKESEERRLRAQVAEYQRRIESVPGIESDWTKLTRDYDTQKEAYRELLSKSEAAKLAVDLERRQIGEQFRVLDPARVPTRPIGPARLQINGIGLGIGLALGIAIAAIVVIRDSTFRTEADVLQVLSLPVLAIVPLVEGEIERRRRGRMRLAASVVVTGTVVAGAYVFWSLQLWKFMV